MKKRPVPFGLLCHGVVAPRCEPTDFAPRQQSDSLLDSGVCESLVGPFEERRCCHGIGEFAQNRIR